MVRRAFTFVEVLVVLAIIGILVALLLPAVQYTRESARRIQCSSNVKQILLAVHQYEGVNRIIPPGNSKGFSFLAAVIPYVEQDVFFQELYGRIDVNVNPMDGNGVANKTVVPLFQCPSDYTPGRLIYPWAPTNYGGNSGTGLLHTGRRNGIFQNLRRSNHGDGPLSLAEVLDGMSNTIAVSEILPWDRSDRPVRVTFNTAVGYHQNDPTAFESLCYACLNGQYATKSRGGPAWVGELHGRPWTFGDMSATLYTHSLPPNSPSCYNGSDVQRGIYSFASLHPDGINAGYADGHVGWIGDSVDVVTWRSLGSRDDGAILAP
jgi:prepilin-type N-terminal cleavage/methylation domain-containing protein/prepilin-type processing-associated H-X9-DG protein